MKEKKKNYRDIFKVYFLFLLLAALTIGVFCVYFYNVFVKFQVNYMQQYNRNIISKAYEFQTDIFTVSNSFFNDKNINLYLSNENEAYNESATKSITLLLQTSTISTMYKDVAIKAPENSFIYSTLSQKKESVEDFCEKYPNFASLVKDTKTNFTVYSYQNNRETNLIYAYKNYLGYTIYAFIDGRNLNLHLLNTVHPIDYDIILAESQNIVTQNVSDDNLTIFKELQKINDNSKKFVGNTMVVKTTSKKYSCISTVKISSLLKEATSTSYFFILFAVLIFIIVSAVTYYFYFKQKKFVSEHLKLVNKHLDTSTKNIINKLFNYDVITPADEISLNEYFQINNENYFLPIVIKITNYEELVKSMGNSDVTVYKYGFVNIVTEVFESISNVQTSNIGRDFIGVLLCGETPFDIKTVKAKTDYFESVIEKHFDTVLFSVIGKEAEDIVTVYEQIPTLVNAQNYKFINNENKLVISELAPLTQQVEYPLHIQVAVMAALNAKNPQAFTDGIKKFADYIIKRNSLNGKEWFLKLFLAISESSQITPDISVAPNTLEALLNCGKIDEMVELLSNSVKYLNANTTPDDNSEVTENFDKIVKKTIEEEFSNPDFCIQSITERFGFTASYFGKKFKHNFDVSFNKYLLDYRLNYAVKLLSETNYTNTKIAQMCGFNSETYFMSIFKKNFGMSPKAYKSTYFNKNQK